MWGMPDPDSPDIAEQAEKHAWWQSPVMLGSVAIGITAVLSIIFL